MSNQQEIPPNIRIYLITKLLPPISLCIIINIIDVYSRVISSYSLALFRLSSFDQYISPRLLSQFYYVCYGSRSDSISHVVPISDKLTLERIFGAQLFFLKKSFQKCNEICQHEQLNPGTVLQSAPPYTSLWIR